MGMLLRKNSRLWGAKSTRPSALPVAARARPRERRLRIVQEVQHLMNEDGAGAVLRKRQIINVGEADAAIVKLRIVEADARAFQHFAVGVDPDEPPRAVAASSRMRPVPVPRSRRRS